MTSSRKMRLMKKSSNNKSKMKEKKARKGPLRSQRNSFLNMFMLRKL